MPPLDDQGTQGTPAPSSGTAQPASTPSAQPGSEGGAPEFDMAAGLAEVEKGLFPEESGNEAAAGREGKPAVDSKSEGATPAAAGEPTAPADGTPPAAGALGEAPSTWTKEGKAIWAQLPDVARKEIERREGEITNGFKQLEGERKVAGAFQDVLKPYAHLLQQYNVNPWTNVSNLMDSQAKLVFGTPQEKVAVLMEAARVSGIDLQALVSGQPNVIDDRYVALQRETQELRAQLGGVSTAVVERQTQELEQKVWAFAQDEKAHPFFWDVAADIATLTRQNPNLSLEQAYESAVWSNPVSRQKAIEAQYAKAAEERTRKQAEHAAKSRNATSVNVEGTQARSGTANADEDLEATIRNSLRDIKARA